MSSNVLNPLSAAKDTKEVVDLLQSMASFELTNPQLDNLNIIISMLGDNISLLDVVSACENVLGLREFAIKLGAFTLPGEGYSALYEKEYGPLNS